MAGRCHRGFGPHRHGVEPAPVTRRKHRAYPELQWLTIIICLEDSAAVLAWLHRTPFELDESAPVLPDPCRGNTACTIRTGAHAGSTGHRVTLCRLAERWNSLQSGGGFATLLHRALGAAQRARCEVWIFTNRVFVAMQYTDLQRARATRPRKCNGGHLAPPQAFPYTGVTRCSTSTT